MTRERFLGPSENDPERQDESLRPTRLDDVIGQTPVVQRLRVSLDAARIKSEALGHILLDGPPGLGKTTLASVIPRELGVDFVTTSGPALRTPKDLMPYLTNLTDRSVLFIDEIHRLPSQVEEFIYPAMEDFRIDIVLGEGLGARTLSMPLKRFTLIGATTRSGALTAPMRDRFVLREHLDYYEDEDLIRILAINARKLGVPMEEAALFELARRSRGTPRVANAHLYWIRNYAISRSDGRATLELVREALAMQEVDEIGLDRQDRRYLETLIRVFGGGPAGVEAIAATMNVPSDTLADEVEPYLLRRELIVRTPRGRQATTSGFTHIGMSGSGPSQGSLFGA
jgi:Holliday junction DNA helicase RuvB